MAEGSGVTLEVIASKVDEVLRRLNCIEEANEKREERLRLVEVSDAMRKQELQTLAADVQALKGRDLFGTVVASVLAVIAALIGFLR